MASFSLCIKAAPHSSGAIHGLEFAKACLAQGHRLIRIFFYGEGVYLGLTTPTPPQGEYSVGQAWQDFINAHQIDAVLCISASLRRGVLDATEATRQGFNLNLVSEGFELSGLGQWITANSEADHAITFG